MAIDSLDNQLEILKEDILKMGSLLQEQVYKSNRSLTEKNMELAREVIEKDDILDQMELDIEKKCLYLIALKQPLARDLRFIGTALRIIVDIERMGDHAEDIAKIAIDLYEQTYMKPLIDIPKMAQIAEDMVVTAMKAFIDGDVALAMNLVAMEKQVEALYNEVFRELLSYMMRDQGNIPQATSLLLVAGHLERIADHATNLGEMVIYVVEGRRVDINVMSRS
ncbi:MAG: phosphate transport system regulatory protein PhoU [Firmicutes bacterium HGW-Firmicutes-15]|nr:MAG: phosphate transport system regulatory protein PhoU [Firmicutes bacterium HGW-Firmicutes-15]